MKIRYRLAASLLCCLLVLLAGCSKPIIPPKVPTTGVIPGPEETNVISQPEESNVITEPEETNVITEPDTADPSLYSLRQAMVETPQLFAVAYFGYHDTIDSDLPVDPYEVMEEYTPQLCGDLPFLLDISRERIIGDDGELYCIVPLDTSATVVVSRGFWDENNEEYLFEETLYYSESGEPILMFCNNSGFEPDTQLYISGPSGEIIWYPQLDDNLCAMPLLDDNWDQRFLDFSSYREMLVKDYREMDGEWVKPTEEFLIGTTWVWERWTKDGREVSCRVTFDKDTLSVSWNDGIDEENHEYPDASWELTYEDGYAILSIDFREMAGILRYNLLYHEVYDYLYFGMDVLQEEMPIGWESLHRYMMPPPVPEPVEMLGFWQLEWTEIDGERQYVEYGTETETASIFLKRDGSMRISYGDPVYWQDNLYDKAVYTYEGELYPGCGNDAWAAYIGEMEGSPKAYSLTLLDHDTLRMKIYWETDEGVTMVAYKSFYRVSEYDE